MGASEGMFPFDQTTFMVVNEAKLIHDSAARNQPYSGHSVPSRFACCGTTHHIRRSRRMYHGQVHTPCPGSHFDGSGTAQACTVTCINGGVRWAHVKRE